MAGYVFSNSKLREELASAKDAEAAGKILAKHLSKDGKQLGHEVKKFAESDEVQQNLKKAKDYAQSSVKKLQGELKTLMKEHGPAMKKAAKQTVSKAKKSVKKATK